VEELQQLPREKIRNFCIIAHVDHGKSTLADRLLEIAGNVQLESGGQRQLLDDLKVERERGITVKARTASMIYDDHLINLVDTPGHVDFETEVKRTLVSCQGALLLVDSTQGVQAQTMANYHSALAVGLKVIPVLTKLDLQHSDPARALEQIESALGIPEDDVIWTSAKTGEGCDLLLPAVIERLEPPKLATAPYVKEGKFRARVADSWYDRYKGTICLISVDHGSISPGDKLFTETWGNKKSFDVIDVGQLLPEAVSRPSLEVGMVGYLVGGFKDRGMVNVGDYISDKLSVLDGRKTSGESQEFEVSTVPKVYASLYSVDSANYEDLRTSMDRLTLNDASVLVKAEMSSALGAGFRCGFLGKLHMEVFLQRLEDEFDTDIISTAPTVPYWVVLKDGTSVVAESPAQLPEPGDPTVDHFLEPMANVTLVTPAEYLGQMMELFNERRAEQLDMLHLDENRVILKYSMPWQEVIIDLHDEVKSKSSGFANFDYEEAPPIRSNVCKVAILLNGKPVDALTFACHTSASQKRGRVVVEKLRKAIKRQQYEVIVQAAVGTKVVARERIAPVRKDVL